MQFKLTTVFVAVTAAFSTAGSWANDTIYNNNADNPMIFDEVGDFILSVDAAEKAAALRADQGATIMIGTAGNAENVNISLNNSGTAAIISHRPSGVTYPGSMITIQAQDTVSISSSANGIWVQSGTETQSGADNGSFVQITAKEISIHAAMNGIEAISNSRVTLNADTITISSANGVAIETRGNSEVKIGHEGSTVRIDGDVLFATPSKNSGKVLNSSVSLILSGSDSYWNGTVEKYYPADGSDLGLTEDEKKVSGLSVSLSDGATWTAKPAQKSHYPDLTQDTNSASVNTLTLDGGIIKTVATDQVVKVDHLSVGENGGTFNALTNIDGNSVSTAKLNVSSGAEGTLTVNYDGINSDQLTEEIASQLNAVEGNGLENVQAVHTVKEGNLKGAWTRGPGDDATGSFAENTKLSSYSSITAMSLVQWRNEINHLTKRLGDIRASESTIGAWARVYGGASEWGSNPEVDMDHTTIQVGGDYRINPNWIVGGAFSYTDSDAESSNGFADGESYSLAAYATYLADNGSFLDVIARYGYLKNDITAGNMALETKNNAFSLSVEGGHQFRFIEDRAYIEPQIELTYGFVSGDDADASNGVRIEQDDYQNLITRVGVRTGFDFPEKAGTIYATLSYSYDFLGDADGTASGQTQAGYESVALTEDLGGGWVTYGIGAQFRLGDNAFAYGELERTSGGDIDNPYLFNVGFRYNF